MKFIAVNHFEVVAIEKDGAINLDVEHTKVISVPDDEPVELGWNYHEPSPQATARLRLFHNPTPDPATLKQGVCYAIDEDGNQYVIETPTTA